MVSSKDSPIPTKSKQAIQYAWRQLAKRAGIEIKENSLTGFDSIGINVNYGTPGKKAEDKTIYVRPCAESVWHDILQAEPNSISWLPWEKTVPKGVDLPIKEPIPVLFWGEGAEDSSKPFVELLANGSILFNADVIASTLFMLTRWEEMVVTAGDRHDRFPGIESVAFKQNFLDRPIIDEYAIIIREWIPPFFQNWKPINHFFTIRPTHDVDLMGPLPNLTRKKAIKRIFGDILKRHDITDAMKTSRDIFYSLFFTERYKGVVNIKKLAQVSAKYKLRSIFYFQTAKPSNYDLHYHVSTWLLKNIIRLLQNAGMGIGHHPGYLSYDDITILREEKRKMENLLGNTPFGARPHYLRFKIPDTWNNFKDIGITHDSIGYPDHEGFRFGTCHPFHPFNLEEEREIDILEYPLIIMDTTLKHYRNMEIEVAKVQIRRLAERCRNVGGIFTILWHYSLPISETAVWPEHYETILSDLYQMTSPSKNIKK
jgi:hypothetical protein